MIDFRIFVEGKTDEYFIKYLFAKMLYTEKQIEFIHIGSNYKSLKNKVSSSFFKKGETGKNLVIVDSDIEKEETIFANLEILKTEMNIEFEPFIITTNLEYFYKSIVNHPEFFECMNSLKDCIAKNKLPNTPPSLKDIMYSYFISLMTVKEQKQRDKIIQQSSFMDKVINYEHDNLKDLKKFLSLHLSN